MPVALDRLPFDILFWIAAYLDLDDIVSLGYSCRQLRSLLDEDTLCRRGIETHVPYSREAALAKDGKVSPGQALRRVFDRRNAFSNASPFSASIVGHGTAFTYRQGVLCVLNGSKLLVSDVHSSSCFHALNLLSIVGVATCSTSSPDNEARFSLLHYCDNIVAIHYERKGRTGRGRLLAIDTQKDTPNEKRVIKDITLESSYKLFARHTASFLYYGTYTGQGDWHHEWVISGVSLGTETLSLERPLQFTQFYGTDVGSTIAFEIHDDYFYAVSNQTSYDVEELDWTSFYHCIRFPLSGPKDKQLDVNQHIYRRQHAEGPIHDSWTDLSLQADEATNKLTIVESRREWQNGSSKQLRTFYTSDITFPNQGARAGSPVAGPAGAPLLPADDPFSALVDSSNNPHWAPTQYRSSRQMHKEFGLERADNRSFILAKTKFRAYNLACTSFLDLVEDEKCCSDPLKPLASPCLRLRIGSRRAGPRNMEGLSDLQKAAVTIDNSASSTDESEAFRYSPVRMWPRPGKACLCSKKLHDILNPGLSSGSGQGMIVSGILDERTFIYMIKPGKSYSSTDENTMGTLVAVSFDPDIVLPSPPSTSPPPITPVDSVIDCPDIREDSAPSSHWIWKQSASCQQGKCD